MGFKRLKNTMRSPSELPSLLWNDLSVVNFHINIQVLCL